jgi:hypothetical protein
MTLPKVQPITALRNIPEPGDTRGPFGYGRPAHGSDPHATYVFSPEDVAHTAATETGEANTSADKNGSSLGEPRTAAADNVTR